MKSEVGRSGVRAHRGQEGDGKREGSEHNSQQKPSATAAPFAPGYSHRDETAENPKQWERDSHGITPLILVGHRRLSGIECAESVPNPHFAFCYKMLEEQPERIFLGMEHIEDFFIREL
jgi:hypothetical protein